MKLCPHCGNGAAWQEMSKRKQEPWQLGKCQYCHSWLTFDGTDTLDLSPMWENAIGVKDENELYL